MSPPRIWYLIQLLALLFVILVVSKHALLAPPMLFGDGVEYVLQTQAIVFDRSLAIDPVAQGAYFNQTNPYGKTLLFNSSQLTARTFQLNEASQFGGGFGSLYPALDGTWRYAHSWIYSAAVAPFYVLLHAIQPGAFEYRSFALANLCFMVVPLLLLWMLQPGWASLVFLAALFVSPYTPFLQWAHSEIFCAGTVMTAFALIRYEKWRWLSPSILGLAAAQNIPLILLFPFHLYVYAQQSGMSLSMPRWAALRALVPYAVAVAIPVAVMCQSQILFGQWNVIPALGFADVSNITLQRVKSVVFSPIIGFLWYFPVAVVACSLVVAVGRWREAFLCTASVLAVAILSSTTNNVNSAQLSTTRYSMWFVAVLWVLPFSAGAFQFRAMRRCAVAVIVAAVVLCGGIFWWLKSYTFLRGEWNSFVAVRRAVPEVAALYRWTHYEDDVEVLVENIKGSELLRPHDLSDIYVWNLGAGESMWVVSKRAFAKLGQIRIRLKEPIPSDLSSELSAFSVEQLQPNEVVLRPKAEVSFSRNPYLGSYLILWVSAEVESVEAPVRVVLRD